ncbi:MAG: CDP-alcohol phosphatidyltransferase family protein [Actinomycetota bacterium]|nr:CDP-alcohol phosphatidyltransferase family protein [Actinomycetota bacterium]
MLNKYARAFFAKVLHPVARRLVGAGVSPDVVTLVGTLGVSVGALVFFPRGEFFWGTVFITAFVFSDMIDGAMARLTDSPSRWGAFLDSSLDRVGDAAIFAGIAMWWAGGGNSLPNTALALYCLVVGSLISYVKARAEGLGMTADVGIAERADRLVLVLVMTGLSGLFDLPLLQLAALWILAVAGTVTVVQRVVVVRRQALAPAPRRPA